MILLKTHEKGLGLYLDCISIIPNETSCCWLNMLNLTSLPISIPNDSADPLVKSHI